ncbi:biopolymer transporter ExbD [Vibrio sp. TH_r3]|uniref:ExbD/TolR family protein n=1 Tax=Vibrio sp. TH_r3 TaxID=3082084 RepID=UPI0029547107|nr:biopolymer transporter ExbD [Vibrio sp. TH_r3]MDV7103969.1 biopolymer transporter ExbD [Vibrio sp. TH_r3]
MITSTSQSKASLNPDLTPLLDLIFIVLVFLLLTTNIPVKTMNVSIPQTSDSEVLSSPDKQSLTINLLPETTEHPSSWAINGSPYDSWDTFTMDLIEQMKNNPERMLIIAADKSASVDTMLKLLAFLQKNNITATNIMMDNQQ